MFAFAIWDGRTRTLFLARDRLGKKPLFYYQDAGRFVFASEPKAMLQDPESPRSRTRRPASLPDLRLRARPVVGLPGRAEAPPAHYLLLRDGQASLDRYWSLRYAPKRSEDEPALTEELLARLERPSASGSSATCRWAPSSAAGSTRAPWSR